MTRGGSKVTMVNGGTHDLKKTPEELDEEIIHVLRGAANGVEEGWRFIYVDDHKDNPLRLNVDHIVSIEQPTRTGKATFI